MKRTGCEIYPVRLSQEIRQNPRWRAEVAFYDTLSEQLGSGWLVIYHAPFISQGTDGKLYDGEADFIVSHPDYGTVIIEVKGGEIAIENGEFKSITLKSRQVNVIQNPEEQARNSKWAIVRKLVALPDLKRLLKVPDEEVKRHLCHAVCFPDVVAPSKDLTAALPSTIVIDANDLSNIETKLKTVLRSGCKDARSDPRARLWIQNGLKQLFATQIKLRHPLRLSTAEDERDLVTLTQQQYDVLYQLKFRQRAAIVGCAGSGKTFLAVQQALSAAEAGHRTLLTCFNRPLADFLRSLVSEISNLDVLTVYQLCGKLASEAGIVVPPNAEDLWKKDLPNALSAAMGKLPDKRYDCILVDEAQDISLSIEESSIAGTQRASEQKELIWLALEDCLKDKNQSNFYAFFDTHQALYGNAFVPSELQPIIPLPQNVRNTQSICSAVKLHYEGITPIYSRGPTGASIQAVVCEEESKLSKILIDLVSRLISVEQFSNTDIAILTPRRKERSNIRLSPNFNAAWDKVETSKDVLCSSIYKFKGLERRIAIVTELEDLLDKTEVERKRLCYTAFSRPTLVLIAVGKKACLEALLPSEELASVV